MSWITDLFTGGVDKVITATGAAIHSIVTSDKERLALQNELTKIQLSALQDAAQQADETETKIEEQLTERLRIDTTGDEPMAKKVRPISLIYLLLIVSILALTDGNIHYQEWVFKIGKEYIDLFKALLLLVFSFYFGSRGLEKITALIMSTKK